MVKLIGLLLIVSSLVSLMAGHLIDTMYGSNVQITGNAVENIISQPAIPIWGYDYLTGIMLSYSIISLLAGAVFLFRM